MIVIYSTKTCVYCGQVEKYLQMKKMAFKKIFIDDDAGLRQKLYDITGMLTVPITTDGETYVVGWKVRELNDLIAAQV